MISDKTYAVIPAFNEEHTVGSVVTSVKRTAKVDRVIVVDDGSGDSTARAAKAAGATVLSLPVNSGAARATVIGLRYAISHGANRVVTLDADGQHDPKDIPRLLSELTPGVNMVVGSRYLRPSAHTSSLARRLGTSLISGLIFLRFGRHIADPTSGYRVLDRKIAVWLAKIYPSAFLEPELVSLLLQRRMTIREVAIQMRKRRFGVSSITPLKAVYLMVFITVKILFGRWTGRRG